MRIRRILAGALALGACVVVGCSTYHATDGTEGGKCLYDGTCAAGLSCSDGTCVRPIGTEAGAPESGVETGPPTPDAMGPEAATSNDAEADALTTLTDATTDAPRATEAGVDASDASACPGAAHCERVVFVTSALHDGTFASLAGAGAANPGMDGADAFCQHIADSSTLSRVNGHSFVAWISDSKSQAADRLVHGDMPYVLPNGTIVAANWAELTSGTFRVPINRSENDITLTTNSGTWTGTSGTGMLQGGACQDWTTNNVTANGIHGDDQSAGSTWSNNGYAGCNNVYRVFCFEK